MKRMTNEDFISKSKEVWKDKYDYSLVEYKNIKTKIKIIYNDWIFLQKAEDHFLPKKHLTACLRRATAPE